ncbi:MAG: hypothetical protein AB4038_04625 [Prochloraceae cyanobacterium]
MAAIRFYLITFAALTIVACSGLGSSENNWGIIYGEVIAGPSCPEQIDMSDCQDQPVEGARLILLDANSQEVNRIQSDKNGQFSIQVPFGYYYLVPMPVRGLMGTPNKFPVTIEQKKLPAPITIKYDTGIRSVTPPSLD